MAGSVAFAVRKNGKVSTTVLSKRAAEHVNRVDFFEEKGELWSHLTARGKDLFAPSEYGLIVADFDEKWVGAVQGYSLFNQFNLSLREPSSISDLQDLWDAGRVVKLSVNGNSLSASQHFDLKEVIDLLVSKDGSDQSIIHVESKPPSGWTLENYSNNQDGWSDFVSKLGKLGVDISKKDLPEWVEYFNAHQLPTTILGKALAEDQASDLFTETAQVHNSGSRPRI